MKKLISLLLAVLMVCSTGISAFAINAIPSASATEIKAGETVAIDVTVDEAYSNLTGLEAIILSEQANKGKTIIEKFEENSDVGAAICLFTGDDIGKEKSEAVEKQRARQNVVYEAGYFMGKLGRERVIMLVDEGIELPSDLQGVVYTVSESWKTEVLQELQSIGYAIDFNKLFKR